MLCKGLEGHWRVQGSQLVTMAAFWGALVSGVLGHAGVVSAAQNPTISVSNVDALYAAVNNEANAGAAVVLAPGVYTLSARDAGGALRPNGGRLDLQPDMSLYGSCSPDDAECVADARDVVIDAGSKDEFGKRLLPPSSFAVDFGRTGVIRAGCGSNRIEWLTIAGNPAAAASIETELVATNLACQPLQTAIRVAHVVSGGDAVSGGSARGVDIRSVTAAMAGHRIVAELEDNDIYFAGEGIRVINFANAHESEIIVDMRDNHLHGNVVGCVLENNRSNDASIVVRSYRDRFDDNQLGCTMGGGFVNNKSGQTADSNTTRFDAVESHFTNNTRTSGFNTEAGTPEFTDTGGIVVSGGGVGPQGKPNTANDNTAIVRFWDVTIADNVTIDNHGKEFLAFGARCEAAPCKADPPEGLAGTGNHVLIQPRGLSASTHVVETPSEPPDPSGTNTVTVVPKTADQ